MPICNERDARWRVIGVLASYLLASSAALAADTPYGEVEVPFEVKQIPRTQVYYVIGQSGVPGPDNQGHTSNAGFVITAKGVVVYDALGTPALSHLLIQDIRKRTDKPVALVVAGHYHADHVYGLQAFKEHTKAVVWAHESAFSYIGGAVAEERLEQRRGVLYPWIDEDTYVVKPDRTFKDRQRFDMGDTHIELVYVGPAHAPDDTIMVVKEAGVVFSGDLIFSGRLPFLGGENVSTKNWLKGLDYLQKLKPPPRVIVPGHGQVATNGKQAISFTRDYIAYLRQHMGQAAKELIPFEEAYDATDWSRYKKMPTFAQANRGNAYNVYLEMQASGF